MLCCLWLQTTSLWLPLVVSSTRNSRLDSRLDTPSKAEVDADADACMLPINCACMLACADNIAVAEGNITKIEATVDTEGKEDYSTQEVIEAMIGKDLAHVNFNVKTATK